jgi:hypothetical protein
VPRALVQASEGSNSKAIFSSGLVGAWRGAIGRGAIGSSATGSSAAGGGATAAARRPAA